MTRNQTPELDTFGWKVYNIAVLTIMWSIPVTAIVLSFLGVF